MYNQKHKHYGFNIRNRTRKNIANFQDLISFCEGYGSTYNPTKESLKIPKLQALYQEAQNKLNEAKTQKQILTMQPMKDEMLSAT